MCKVLQLAILRTARLQGNHPDFLRQASFKQALKQAF